ncbi:MAG: PAS domain S-box protein [Anaerolineales bacterium]
MSLKILIVDDDERVLKTFARNLKMAGHTVLTASRGAQALKVYHEEQPDIVTLDMRMPGMDGFSTLQEIRRHDPEAEVILTTGHGDKEMVIEALRAGASDFIPKPIDRVTLNTALRRAEERIRLRRELHRAQAALQASEARFRAAAENNPNTFSILESVRAKGEEEEGEEGQEGEEKIIDFRFVYVNNHLPAQAAWDRDEIIGRTISEIFPRNIAQSYIEKYARVVATGEPLDEEYHLPTDCEAAGWYHQQAVPLSDGIAITNSDITERKRMEAALRAAHDKLEHKVAQRTAELQQANATLQRRNQELALLERASQAFNSSLEIDEVLISVLQEVQHLLGVDAYSVWLRDEATGELVCQELISPHSDLVRGWRLGPGQGIAGWVQAHGESLLIDDVQEDARYFSGVEEMTGYTWRSTLTVPLRTPQQVIGVIQLLDTAPARFQSEDLRLLEPLAAAAARAFHNAQLYAQAQQEITERKQVEARYRTLLKASPDAIVATDVEGHITHFSDSVLAILEAQSVAEIQGQHILTWVVEEDRERARANMQRVLAGEYSRKNRYILRSQTDKRFIGEVNSGALHDAAGQLCGMISIIRNVTDREQAKQALIQREKRFRSLVQNASDLIVIVDDQAIIQYISPSSQRILGYAPDELIGQHSFDFIHPNDAKKTKMTLSEVIQQPGQTLTINFRFRHQDGSWRWLEAIGSNQLHIPAVGGVVTNARDVTEQYRMEKALRESETKYRTLVESAEATIATVNYQGDFLFMNSIGAQHLGGQPEDFIGKNMWDLFPKKIADRQMGTAREVMETNAGIVLETQTRLQGEPRWYRTSVQPLNFNAHAPGRPADAALIIGTDITEIHRMREKLRDYADELEQRVAEKVRALEKERAKVIQASKMAAVGEVATGIAHELNQPLTAISFEADYLQKLAEQAGGGLDQGALWDELRNIGEGLAGDIDRSRRIVDHLRTFGRASERNIGPTNLNAPIEGAFILVGERLRQHNIDIHTDLAPDLPPIQANPHRLEQVFLNLLSNAEHALEAMAARVAAGEVERDDYQKRLTIITQYEKEDHHVIARVEDNGVGIPGEAQANIFTPFFTTKPAGKGTGLGLSISKGIVEDFGGEIEFESEKNRGTIFTLRFPIHSNDRSEQ